MISYKLDFNLEQGHFAQIFGFSALDSTSTFIITLLLNSCFKSKNLPFLFIMIKFIFENFYWSQIFLILKF